MPTIVAFSSMSVADLGAVSAWTLLGLMLTVLFTSGFTAEIEWALVIAG